jgi:hypothetical protein
MQPVDCVRLNDLAVGTSNRARRIHVSLSLSKLAFVAPIAALAIAAFSRPASADVAWGAQISIGGGAPFAPALAPYGRWVVEPRYGQVFVPNDRAFVPYTQGHWVEGDAGLTWVSDTPFGDTTEHYGRWIMTGYGWAWIPGSEYSPAWVEWRDAGDSVGWAPLGPEGAIADVNAWHFVPASALRARMLRPYYQPGATYYPRSRVLEPGRRYFAPRRELAQPRIYRGYPQPAHRYDRWSPPQRFGRGELGWQRRAWGERRPGYRY